MIYFDYKLISFLTIVSDSIQKVHITEPIEIEDFKIDHTMIHTRTRTFSSDEGDFAQKDEFLFENLIRSVGSYNKIYDVSIADKDLVAIRKDAIFTLINSQTQGKFILS